MSSVEKSYYFDNAATSFPKAPGVAEAMTDYLTRVGCNVGRGDYQSAYTAAERVLEVREKLCRRFGAPDPRNVIFTPGCTYGLNAVLKGVLKPGDLVAASPMEHNAVLRPLKQLERQGVRIQWLPCADTGELLLDQAVERLTKDVRLCVLTHASNVCGTLMPVEAVGRLCRERGIFFCVDAAQSAGLVPVNMDAMGIDAVAMPAHKGLLGPQGLGVLLLTDALAEAMEPLISGGTGSRSDLLEMPPFLPDRLEPGTLNLPGIYGLGAALDWWERQDMAALRHREERLTGHLIARLAEYEEDGLRVLGTREEKKQVGVVSVDFLGRDNAECAYRLERDYGIQTRCGLHCAPLTHKTLGTYPQGTVRFSVGPFTRFEDIDYVQGAVAEILCE